MQHRILIMGLVACMSVSLSACGCLKVTVNDKEIIAISNTKSSEEESAEVEESLSDSASKQSTNESSIASEKEKNTDKINKESVANKVKSDKSESGLDRYWNISGIELELTDDKWVDTTPETDKFVCKQFTVRGGENDGAVIQVVLADAGYTNFSINNYAEKYGNNYQNETIEFKDGSSGILYSWIDKESGQVVEKLLGWPLNVKAEITLTYNLSKCNGAKLNSMLHNLVLRDADKELGISHESLSEPNLEKTSIIENTEDMNSSDLEIVEVELGNREDEKLQNKDQDVITNSEYVSEDLQGVASFKRPSSWEILKGDAKEGMLQYYIGDDGSTGGVYLFEDSEGRVVEEFVSQLINRFEAVGNGMVTKYGTNGSDNKLWDDEKGFKHTIITMTMGGDTAYNNIYYKSSGDLYVFVVTTTANMGTSSEISELLESVKINS